MVKFATAKRMERVSIACDGVNKSWQTVMVPPLIEGKMYVRIIQVY